MDKKNENNNVLTAEQIAALFDSQSDTAPSQEQPAVVEEQTSVNEESNDTEPELQNEPEAPSNGMLTAEQIAALFDSQSDSATSQDQSAVAKEQTAIKEEQSATEQEPSNKPEVASNGMLTAEQIAALFDSQGDTATSQDKPVVVEEQTSVNEESNDTEPEPEPELKSEPESTSNGMLTAEQIAALFDSQSDTATSQEEPAVVQEQAAINKEPIATESKPELKNEPESTSNGMLTAEQIAALFDSQGDTTTSQEQVAVVKEETSVNEESIATEPEPELKSEPESTSNGMLTAEQIAALFDSQSDTAASQEQPAINKEPIATESKPELKSEPESTSNGMLTAEQIAALFDSQGDTATSQDKPAVVEEQTSVNEESNDTESKLELKSEPESTSNGMLTTEQIAALFDSQSDTAASQEQLTVGEEQTAINEEQSATGQEPSNEPEAPSNGMLTAEQIAALFDSQSDTAPSQEQPAVVQEQTTVNEEPIATEPERSNEPEVPSNGMLTAEQIAALFDSQSDTAASQEQPSVVEEQTTLNEEPNTIELKPDHKIEPEAPSNGMLTAEQIAALFDSQSNTAPSQEQPAVVQEQTTVSEEPIATEPERSNEPELPSNGMLTAEQIAALFDSQNATTASQEQPSVVEEQTAINEKPIATEPEAPNKPEVASNGMLTAEEIAALFDSQDENDTSQEQPAVIEEQTSVNEESIATEPELQNESEAPPNGTLTAEESSKSDTDKSPSKEKSSIVSRLIISINNLLSKVNRLISAKKESSKNSVKKISKESKLQSSQEISQVDIMEYPTNPMDLSVNASLDEVELDEEIIKIPEKSTKGKKAAKSKEPKKPKTKSQKSGLKVALLILGVFVLMSGSFVSGYFSRDFISMFKPDPVKAAAQAEEKAKLADQKAKEEEKAKRAEELAAIDPKEYTSSMYLESIILKGQADSKTSIKLNKIDDVSLLTQFPKLRRIRLYNMTGNEDLSVIQKLSGVEEILIESSVLKNQFAKGTFNSVTYIEMTDCKVENSNQFANFKKVTELYADNTKFISNDGKLQVTSYMPTLESLTLNNCGKYDELVNVQNLKHLKKLKLSDNTIVKNTSYVQNPQIETVTVDISFVKSSEELIALSSLQSLISLTIEVGETSLSTSELSDALDWIASQHPNATIKISTY